MVRWARRLWPLERHYLHGVVEVQSSATGRLAVIPDAVTHLAPTKITDSLPDLAQKPESSSRSRTLRASGNTAAAPHVFTGCASSQRSASR